MQAIRPSHPLERALENGFTAMQADKIDGTRKKMSYCHDLTFFCVGGPRARWAERQACHERQGETAKTDLEHPTAFPVNLSHFAFSPFSPL